MKFKTIMTISILFIFALSCRKPDEKKIASVKTGNILKDQIPTNKNIRSKNISIIDTQLSHLQNQDKIGREPLIKINNEVYSYKEYITKRDTILALEKGEIKSISIYSETCSNELKEIHNRKENSRIFEVITYGEKVKDVLPLKSSNTNMK